MSRLFPKSDPEKDTAIMLGDPKKAIFVTVIPFMISIFIGQVNMLADVMWCSGLGSDYISAIQVVSPIYWVIFDVGLGIGLGCNVLIARRIGAGDRIGAQSIISHGFSPWAQRHLKAILGKRGLGLASTCHIWRLVFEKH